MIFKKIIINPDILKFVALVTMTIDHLYKNLLPTAPSFFIASQVFGRMAMPLFAGLLMYHLAKKKVFKKYLIRLFCFGIISFFLFMPFSVDKHTAAMPFNILLSFFLSILTIYLMESVEKDNQVSVFIKRFAQIIIFLFIAPLTIFFEYEIYGFCYFLMFYFYFKSPNMYKLFVLLILGFLTNEIGIQGIISMLTTLFFVNVDMEKKYTRLIKHWYTFYMYYPLHKVLFFSLAYLMIS